MRWKTNTLQNGNRRTVKYFALLPTDLDDGYTVWLESYWASEVWDDGTTSTGFGYWKMKSTSLYHPDKPTTGGNKIPL
jgi:aminopeptidase N